MHRRGFVLLSATSLAGCLTRRNSGKMDLLDECPVDRLDDRDPPPENLDRDSAKSYVEAYEEAYIEATVIENQRYDRVEGPGANVLDVSPVDDGYHVHVETSWAAWHQEDDELVFEVIEVVEREPVPADHDALATNSVLQDHLEQAVEEGRSSVLRESHRSYEETYTGIMEASGEVDGVVVEYDDRLIQVSEREGPVMHFDGYDRSRYYVAPGVLYRSDHDRDPRDGILLECRSASATETRP